VIAGSLFWAIAQVLARKLGRDDGLVQLKGVAIAGLPQLILATLLLERGQWQSMVTARAYQWLALAFVGAIGFYCAYAAWYALLRRFPVDTVAPFTLLMPVVGIVTAALVLGETIKTSHIVGGLIIVGGLMVITGFGNWGRRSSAAA
jgi:O-acetylserine/cysteine efflux transporter